jgi:dihydroorotate dehydrogenase electron transfer subunit
MHAYQGQVIEIQLQDGLAAWIACPRPAVPSPGRYLMAWALGDLEAPLAVPLFPSRIDEQGFLAAAPTPSNWQPGTRLALRGPCGNGFRLPASLSRLALAALGESAARLLPLVDQALQRQAAVALFCDTPLPPLPAAVEVNPSSALPDALAWADFLALDISPARLPALGHSLGVTQRQLPLPCPGQALVFTDMPCGGLANCGACAVETRRGWKLACREGPVFELRELIG